MTASAMTLTGFAPANAVSKPTGAQCVTVVKAYKPLAVRMAKDITARLQGRVGEVGLNLTDSQTGVTCWYHPYEHFYAASVIKVTILGALMHKAQVQHRALTETELQQAWLMITQSDNAAANYLWFDVGHYYMQRFLDLAKMRETKLATAWGLTLITAHDELLLLNLITGANPVLNQASRIYIRYLMHHVIAAQRWGVPAGTPRDVLWHVKNGWLPYPGSAWEINSIGTFTTTHRAYLITMLTYGNPSMAYGIDTIENAAEVIQALLNPGKHAVMPRSAPSKSWGIPDEPIPAR
ncbi:MAG TPA: serine hydrolase [Streptosporangiaceae bacterium]|nr:serine hydrolase [Streptosporangiaceae bacterium]